MTIKKLTQFDLSGNVYVPTNLRERYIVPPFSVIDTKNKNWQVRKRNWLKLGIKSELGRDVKFIDLKGFSKYTNTNGLMETSVFDAALCEVMYSWFSKDGGKILDPFAGGSVRGIVANYLGYKYTGIEIREEQIESNIIQCKEIFNDEQMPEYICGDSNKVLDKLFDNDYDFVFSCPPYADLEVYSDIDGDISNMDYDDFKKAYFSIIKKSCQKLKKGCYAVFVVSEVRNKNGNYYGFVQDTIEAFKNAGCHYYNEIILLNSIGTARLRTKNFEKNKKAIRIHQNILCFKKE